MALRSFIRFRKRHEPTDFAIPDADLVDVAEHERLQITRGSEKELPIEVTVAYSDYTADYAQGTQYTRRLIGNAEGKLNIEFPVITEYDHAKLISEVALYRNWLNRTTYTFATTQAWAHLEPTDCGTVTCEGIAHVVLITGKKERADGVVEFTGVAEDATMYEASEPGVPMPAPPQTAPRYARPCHFRILDIPRWRGGSSDVAPGFYAYAEPIVPSRGFSGAELFLSTDGGTNWAAVGYQPETTAATFGVTTSALAAPDDFGVPDEENAVTVQLRAGALAGTDWSGLLARTNLALVGDEIIAFRDVSEAGSGSGVYELRGLLRGLFGTEWAAAEHAQVDRFVMLDNAIKFITLAESYIGSTLVGATVARGQGTDVARQATFVWTGECLKPRAPVNIGAGRTVAGDITIQWTPRSRAPVTLQDFAEYSLPEDFAATFEIEIYDPTFTTLYRTLASNSSSVIYTAAEQTVDVGSPQLSTLGVRVYQVSVLSGSPTQRGHAGEVTVSV